MKNGNKKTVGVKLRRTLRVRSAMRGTAEKPRMCVVKTNQHIYVQLIDDVQGLTLAAVQTVGKSSVAGAKARKSKETAKVIGDAIAEKATALGIKKVIFDRGASKYHGILAELADAVRARGLQC
jgi:large subunit ribosomal protein L18